MIWTGCGENPNANCFLICDPDVFPVGTVLKGKDMCPERSGNYIVTRIEVEPKMPDFIAYRVWFELVNQIDIQEWGAFL